MIRDLMIGNSVLVKETKDVIMVHEIKLNGITSHSGNHYNFIDIEGIPLDENQLLSLGFSKWEGKGSSSSASTYTKGDYILHKRLRGFVTSKREGIVRYVHELQNRFYVTRSKHL